VLNLASGPCRDVSEALTRVEKIIHKQSLFHCVDMDESAIVYARNILNKQSTLAKIQFENANVFNFRPHQKYNLVWSAGLFDYLDDRLATLLLKKMWRWTKAGGEIIFGNFHHRNPSRNYMEWGGGWFLNHRTEEDIFRICKLAGIPLEFVHIDADQLGVCMFCVISKPE
jgi:SAM-dependent methyltransferase